MKRRLNSTGRVRIPLGKVSIRLIDDGESGPQKFVADLSGLASMELNPEAHIIVEPFVKASSMRFDFGTVGAISAPQDLSLTEIDRGALVQFRIKVVDASENPGRLLASADAIRPLDENDEDGSNRKSLLPLQETDLGEVVWMLDCEGPARPVLMINSRIPHLSRRLMEDPVLQGSIFPAAVREVLERILINNEDSSADWVEDWLTFAQEVLGEEIPHDMENDVAKETIQSVVAAFCAQQRWGTRALERLNAAAGEADPYE